MTVAVVGAVVEAVQKQNPGSAGTGEFTYVDLSSVDQQTKAVTGHSTVDTREAPSRARQLISTGDVLVSTVRPNLNAVAWVPPELDGATASTGFCVLRPRRGSVDSRYLFHWVRSPQFVGQMVTLATGASYPAISDKIVKNSSLPLPPIEQQRQIAAVLDAADALRAKRRQALARLDTLTQAIFIDMFGQTATDTAPLHQFFSENPIFGTMKPPSESGDWLDLRVGNIQDNRLDLTDQKYVNLTPDEINRHSVRDGDLLLARAIASIDHLGKCIVARPGAEKWAFDSHLMRVRLNRAVMRPDFLKAWLSSPSGRRAFLKVARRSSVQFNVNTKEMSRLPVPVVPVAAQSKFEEGRAQVAERRTRVLLHKAQLDALFASLQQRAFRGEL